MTARAAVRFVGVEVDLAAVVEVEIAIHTMLRTPQHALASFADTTRLGAIDLASAAVSSIAAQVDLAAVRSIAITVLETDAALRQYRWHCQPPCEDGRRASVNHGREGQLGRPGRRWLGMCGAPV